MFCVAFGLVFVPSFPKNEGDLRLLQGPFHIHTSCMYTCCLSAGGRLYVFVFRVLCFVCRGVDTHLYMRSLRVISFNQAEMA